MIMTQLLDLGVVLVGPVVAITAAVVLGLWMKGETHTEGGVEGVETS